MLLVKEKKIMSYKELEEIQNTIDELKLEILQKENQVEQLEQYLEQNNNEE